MGEMAQKIVGVNIKDLLAILNQAYEQYMNEGDLETFIQRYTSKNGDKIVAFGEYGYC